MDCPHCNKPINRVFVTSRCYQTGHLHDDSNVITSYSRLEISDTIEITCPECDADILEHIEE